MKKIVKIAVLVLTISMLFSCADNGSQHGEDGESGSNAQSFVLKGVVRSVDEKIEVEVIESDYAFGTYLVITSENTDFIANDGAKINKSDIKNGDIIEITYNGQTMLSLPPQIVAHKIKVI